MLLDQLQSDLAEATKARDQIKVDALRFLLGAVRNYEIEKYPPSSNSGGLTDQDVQTVIAKQVKSRKESIVMFEQAKRQDLVEKETAGMNLLQTYLPAQMSEEEIKTIIVGVKDKNPGVDFGTLMKLSMAQLKGKADGATVSKLITNS